MGRPAPWTLPARSAAIARTCANASVNKSVENRAQGAATLLRSAFFFMYFLSLAMAASCADGTAVGGGVCRVVGIEELGEAWLLFWLRPANLEGSCHVFSAWRAPPFGALLYLSGTAR